MDVTGHGVLLLDLDGVVVFECGPPHLQKLELLRLHDNFVDRLARFGVPVVVLTHRSRKEAQRILASAGIDVAKLAGVAAAEDLALAAFRHGNIRRLITKGLRKNLILPLIEARFGISRGAMALLDDRLDNLMDLRADGLGLALHAPSDITLTGQLVTFDLDDAITAYLEWQTRPVIGHVHSLRSAELELADWRRTGLSTKKDGRHLFNVLRTSARHIRRSIDRLLGR